MIKFSPSTNLHQNPPHEIHSVLSLQLDALLGVPPEPQNSEPESGQHENDDPDDEVNLFEKFCNNPHRGMTEDGPSMSMVLVTMFDLITKHKWTISSASDVWSALRVLLPGGEDLGSFEICKKILEAHLKKTLVEVDSCINDCMLFHDFKHPKLSGPEFQNSHRSRCLKCNEPRWYGNKKPRKTVYFFPCKQYFRGNF